ncbi:MAG: metalloprotease family protein [Ignisphaera sp.]|uniref:DUF3267 domain-containing protein n=1 Tax=Ignisphaera aggregans TaxID=334771 RepID=A0A7C4JIR6_9CREN
MKLKIAMQILLGFTASWAIASIAGKENIHHLLLSLPVLGFTHELLHLVSLKLFKLKYKFTLNGFLIGFRATFVNHTQFAIAATIPQILTLSLALAYLCTSNTYALALSMLHIAISYEDMMKVLKYLVNYLV